jgi:hypothetical protein|tara:strand:- start:600 stop:1001 length:402 start_codon:yes stop_codon:yes gene_type:complete
MATAIVTKNSSTPAAVPVLADLVAGELAVNTADGTLFAGTGAGVIQIGDPDAALTNEANTFTQTNTFADINAADVNAADVVATSFAGDGSLLTGLPASGVTAGNGVDAIEVMTAAAYTALATKVATTMYILIG